jgi:hypothetical protein
MQERNKFLGAWRLSVNVTFSSFLYQTQEADLKAKALVFYSGGT